MSLQSTGVPNLKRFDNIGIMEITQAVKSLSALAQESRLDAFRLLVVAGPDGMAAGQIAEQLDVPPATLSFHLKELTNAGLIDRRRAGRSIIYGLNVEGMRRLLGFITQDCCQGKPELCELDYECDDGSCKTKKKKTVAAK